MKKNCTTKLQWYYVKHYENKILCKYKIYLININEKSSEIGSTNTESDYTTNTINTL